MAATEELEGIEKATREDESSFVWDENTKLYYHASTGFYHDPVAGWYYRSSDGSYFTFENGCYKPLHGHKDDASEAHQFTSSFCTSAEQNNQYSTSDPCLPVARTPLTGALVSASDDIGHTESASDGIGHQRPTSEWLEETLINFYLSGCPSSEANIATCISTEEGEDQFSCEVPSNQLTLGEVLSHQDIALHHNKECDSVSECVEDASDETCTSSPKGNRYNEDSWLAQYGQVVQSENEDLPLFDVTELWDWEMVVKSAKKGCQEARLVGRIVRPFTKLHPSLGGLIRTAAICKVHLDLIQVASGKIYRLRRPSKRYLNTVAVYDASNPTKDWGFPDLLLNMQSIDTTCSNPLVGSQYLTEVNGDTSFVTNQCASPIEKKDRPKYRDRAAERRNLHGSFNIGPGQKVLDNNIHEADLDSTSDAAIAASESMNLTFGPGSYSRRILESMGWKEGDALGKTTKGIREPLQAVGNKGNAGLGWKNARTNI